MDREEPPPLLSLSLFLFCLPHNTNFTLSNTIMFYVSNWSNFSIFCLLLVGLLFFFFWWFLIRFSVFFFHDCLWQVLKSALELAEVEISRLSAQLMLTDRCTLSLI
jgi:hypothetical protein